jgi:two-component system, chemotaxis family, sensor kinase CheA
MANFSLSPDILAPIRAVFFQECEELLSVLDGGLTTLKHGDRDPEIVNTIFRAVHSIKGGAANFELHKLVRFSHQYEAVLSNVRAGKVRLESLLLRDLLSASDALANLVEEARGGAVADENRTDEVLRSLSIYVERRPIEAGLSGGASDAAVTPEPAIEEKAGIGAAQKWIIRFRPRTAFYRTANDPLLVLRELNLLGPMEVTLDDGGLPFLEDLQPESSYLAWVISLTTAYPEQAIRHVFEFVMDDCELEISCLEAKEAISPACESSVTEVPIGIPQQSAQSADGKSRQSIRVELDRVDRLFNLVGELLVSQTMFAQHIASHAPADMVAPQSHYTEFGQLTREIQESVLAIRAQPMKPIFQRMSRLVRQLEGITGKTVTFVTEGDDAEVDRSVIERLADPLTHLIRNAIDHGIEPAEERLRAGKSPQGAIRMSAVHRFGRIVLEVADDGRGIDRERVRSIAISRGIIARDAELSEQEVNHLIFTPGFSTAETVSEISGRGVGMDVVNKSVRALGGRISVTSVQGKGSVFSLSLPLTLALLDGMVVSVAGQRLVVPVTAVLETLQARPGDIKRLGSAIVLRFRDRYIPLIELARVLGYSNTAATSDQICIVVEDDLSARVAFLVDDIYGRQQIVVKNIQGSYRTPHGISAATILGEGQVALILDINDIVESQRERQLFASQCVA